MKNDANFCLLHTEIIENMDDSLSDDKEGEDMARSQTQRQNNC